MSELYLGHAAERYVEETEEMISDRIDSVQIQQLFEAIAGGIGSETEMVRLNELFVGRFLKVKPLDVYMQSYTMDLIDNLIHRDMQTDRTVLQILLDRQES